MGPANDSAQWIENRAVRGRFRWPDPRELWQYRELAWFLALRDLKVRYKQAAFGALWAVAQPVAGVVVFTIVFQRMADLPSDGVPYPLFAYVGLTLWTYVSGAATKSAQSLVNNTALVTKVYFPRVLAPAAAVVPGFVDLVLALLVGLPVLMIAYGLAPPWALVTLPVWLVGLAAVVLGAGLWLGTLNVRYRDVNHVIVLIFQLMLFVSPVAYPTSLVPEQWQLVYAVNPVSGLLEASRWAVLGTPWPGIHLLISSMVAGLLLVGGLAYFQRAERKFADII